MSREELHRCIAEKKKLQELNDDLNVILKTKELRITELKKKYADLNWKYERTLSDLYMWQRFVLKLKRLFGVK